MSNAGSTTRVIGGVLTTLLVTLYSCSAICPPNENFVPIDLDKFAQDWYVAATTVEYASSGTHFAVNKTSGDSFSAVWTMNLVGKDIPTNSSVSFVLDGKTGSDIKGGFHLAEADFIKSPVTYRFIAMDISYVSMLICNPDTEYPTNGWGIILSKEKSLAPNTLNDLKNNLQTYFLDQTIFTIVHSN